ncbi:MAG: PDZ domain-containing protein [Proteobacteria bacterium]|nr:PDZ domain-containing protein [Pseudomonadota bacterium]
MSIAKLRKPTLVVVSTLALASCAGFRGGPDRANPDARVVDVERGHYFIAPQRDANVVAELRAAPVPAQPEIVDGIDIDAERRKANAKGYVRIGVGCHPFVDAAARAWVARQGVEHGADKVYVYALSGEKKFADRFVAETAASCATAIDPADVALLAEYYVRFKLPFGAQFRSLTDDEKRKLGVAGGVQIGKVSDGTPASSANLRPGDVVLEFNGDAVRDLDDFRQRLRAHMGKRVTLTVDRGGVRSVRIVRLGVLANDTRDAKK